VRLSLRADYCFAVMHARHFGGFYKYFGNHGHYGRQPTGAAKRRTTPISINAG
jgi:hypothetical protein